LSSLEDSTVLHKNLPLTVGGEDNWRKWANWIY